MIVASIRLINTSSMATPRRIGSMGVVIVGIMVILRNWDLIDSGFRILDFGLAGLFHMPGPIENPKFNIQNRTPKIRDSKPRIIRPALGGLQWWRERSATSCHR